MESWEKGGPNDPTVTFSGLSEQLVLCKEEFSPWSWREYISEFAERMDAEKRLRSLNALPQSGAEDKDGVVKGTPMWQERLDKMLLVEHLKKKIMTAHSRLVEGCSLLLKSHSWLVKNPLLADAFSFAIRHVPPSQFDRIDILQMKLEQKRKELKQARDFHEDYRMTEYRNRDAFLKKSMRHLSISCDLWILDDVVLSWQIATKSMRLTNTRLAKGCMELRNGRLETSLTAQIENNEEARRQFKESLDFMTEDRDKFKKLYNRMVEAHERAKRDLAASQGTVEGMKNMIMVLSQEKAMLEHKVADLEDDKRRMEAALAKLRDEVAMLREEIRRECALMRRTEQTLMNERKETATLLELQYDMEAAYDRAVAKEVQLRDENAVYQVELGAMSVKHRKAMGEIEDTFELLGAVQDERDGALAFSREMEAEMMRTLEECGEQIWAISEKARRDLQHFKDVELARLLNDFQRKTDAILRRNELLEKEVAIGDDLAPHLQVLNPLAHDASKCCAMCRKAIIFEGAVEI